MTSDELFNPNLPLNGIVQNGAHVTQSIAYYEALACEQFAANRDRNMEIARQICLTYAGTVDGN